MTSTLPYGSSNAVGMPSDFAMYNSHQVTEWARSINMSPSTVQYIQANNVTGRDVLAANEEQMRNIFGANDGSIMYRALDPYRMRGGNMGNTGGMHGMSAPATNAGGGFPGMPGFLPFWGSNPNAHESTYNKGKKAGKGALLGSALCASLYGCLMLGLLISSLVLAAILLRMIYHNENSIHRLDRGIERIGNLNNFRAPARNLHNKYEQPLAVMEWNSEKFLPNAVTFSFPSMILDGAEHVDEIPLFMSNGERVGFVRFASSESVMTIEAMDDAMMDMKKVGEDLNPAKLFVERLAQIRTSVDKSSLNESMGKNEAVCKTLETDNPSGLMFQRCISWDANHSKFHISLVQFNQ